MATIQKNTVVQNQQDFIRLQDLLYLCLAKWHWFVISLIVCLGVSIWYLLTTPPIYIRTASILIKDDSKGKSTVRTSVNFNDIGMFSTNTDVKNEMATLRSPDIMREVACRLHLDMNYSVSGRFHSEAIYGRSLPVEVSISDHSEDEPVSFTLLLSTDRSFVLSDFKRNGKDVPGPKSISGKMDKPIKTPIGSLTVVPTSVYRDGYKSTISVSRVPMSMTVAACVAKLRVSQIDEESNIINISYQDVSTQRAEDLLSTLITVYNENWLKDRNQIAVSTSMFIKERLDVIENELSNVDNDISSYKSQNLLPDVQAVASMYMSRANQGDALIQELNNQVYMVRHIRNYLNTEANRYTLLPAGSGIDNSSITGQISAYNNLLLERNSLVANSSDKNPLVVEMDASLASMRSALLASVDNQLVALNAQITSYQNSVGQATSHIESNPKQAKYLLSVERQQKVKESLYLYLLQKREETELSQAFTAYNTRIVAMPSGSMVPAAPASKKILLMGFALGLMIPLVIIFIRENMDTVVRGRKDLESLTIPFVGEIPFAYRRKRSLFSRNRHAEEKSAVVVKDNSRNVINEAFRVLRTNLEFIVGKCDEARIIMTTSANPGSGKTFLSYNLAKSMAIKGKRILIIDLDLRKASLSGYVNKPKPGISDYLVGQINSVDEIIYQPTDDAILSVIPVGTIPPNPTELLFAERLERLLTDMRKEYDYIFIDCPPVEIVADASIINKLVDMTLFVVRAGLLDRSMLPEIEKFYMDRKYKNMALVLNATDAGSGRYGYKYGYKYGYHYGYAGYGKDD